MMASRTTPQVNIFQLFFQETAWLNDFSDPYGNKVYVETTSVPSGKARDKLNVDLIRIFSSEPELPPEPETMKGRKALLRAIEIGLGDETGKVVNPCKWDTIIYGNEE